MASVVMANSFFEPEYTFNNQLMSDGSLSGTDLHAQTAPALAVQQQHKQ